MGRRSVGLALLSLALVLPATASAKPKAPAAEPPKVLVVTSTQDAFTTAGLAAINAAAVGRDVHRHRTRAGRGRRGVHARRTSTTYRAVVFLNTGIASPLTDAQRAAFEAYFRKGGGFVGIGSAIETDPSWQFLTDVLGTRVVEPHRRRRPARSRSSTASTTRASACRSTGTAPDHFYNFTDQRPRRLARARHGRRGPVRPAAAGQRARRHRGRHDGRQPPGLVVQGLPGRPLVLHRARQHAGGVRRRR